MDFRGAAASADEETDGKVKHKMRAAAEREEEGNISLGSIDGETKAAKQLGSPVSLPHLSLDAPPLPVSCQKPPTRGAGLQF